VGEVGEVVVSENNKLLPFNTIELLYICVFVVFIMSGSEYVVVALNRDVFISYFGIS